MFKLKSKISLIMLVSVSSFVLASLLVPPKAQAAIPVECADGYTSNAPTGAAADKICSDHKTGSPAADSVETANANASNAPVGGDPKGDCQDPVLNVKNCGIIYYLVTAINILSGLVGVVIVMMIAIGGIQYSTARDNPQAVAAAKARITNAIIALVASLFIYAFLQYIVPGGLL